MPTPDDHPQRYPLVSELHARPFPALAAPCEAAFLAIKEPADAANRDRARDHAHLVALLSRHGASAPDAEVTHHAGTIGRHALKWESHTEFVTYSAFSPGLSDRPFDPALAEVFPADWRAEAPGRRLAAVLIRVDYLPDMGALEGRLSGWFVPESLAVAAIHDGQAVIAGDFRIDPSGQMRFAVFVRPDTGPQRVGRIVQRLCEIETYRAMSMLGLPQARALNARLNGIDRRLLDLVADMSDEARPAEEVLHGLLTVSAELEALAMRHAFRFGATAAYEAIVRERLDVLRETRLEGWQTFGEFFLRRYDPAMRTVASAERRLQRMAERATRAGELLQTRVDVERQAQNQDLLASMDRRAALQLRLQHTVEGLSVVAIGYYAVSLAAYALAPLAKGAGIGKEVLTAVLVPPVLLAVWWVIRRRIRQGGH
ncbi:DUF3422 family protein [Frigidibacter oleivorans]|uniref:DUF3422 family protein n=1 Tax=Frigidibacter oleivorans TaxID=2487129 RepID=UPI000F8E2256|nr:DUF3422 domain-containing protein [Frigidibacter oleivorans]